MTLLSEGLRIFARSHKSLASYSGTASEICEQVVQSCYNGRFFTASAGHFRQFYSRDFAWCIKPLMRLGYEEEVHSTLSYALECFSRHKRISVAISPSGTPFDYPAYGVDSLASLLYCLVHAKYPADNHLELLQSQVDLIAGITDDSGLVTKSRHFSSARDHYKRVSSCYDNCMLGMISFGLDRLGLDNPLSGFCYDSLLKENFWTGNCFVDDLSGRNAVTGDANVFPYWSGVIRDSSMLKKSVAAIRKNGLDKPFPLKYALDSKGKKFFFDIFTPNYEGTSVWSYLGMLYLGQVRNVNKKLFLEYLEQYTSLIENNRNFLEVFHPDGSPYASAFYLCDESMLWASMYLDLVN